jgi:hypothetical protein
MTGDHKHAINYLATMTIVNNNRSTWMNIDLEICAEDTSCCKNTAETWFQSWFQHVNTWHDTAWWGGHLGRLSRRIIELRVKTNERETTNKRVLQLWDDLFFMMIT